MPCCTCMACCSFIVCILQWHARNTAHSMAHRHDRESHTLTLETGLSAHSRHIMFSILCVLLCLCGHTPHRHTTHPLRAVLVPTLTHASLIDHTSSTKKIRVRSSPTVLRSRKSTPRIHISLHTVPHSLSSISPSPTITPVVPYTHRLPISSSVVIDRDLVLVLLSFASTLLLALCFFQSFSTST